MYICSYIQKVLSVVYLFQAYVWGHSLESLLFFDTHHKLLYPNQLKPIKARDVARPRETI